MKKLFPFVFQLPPKGRIKILIVGLLFVLSFATSIILTYKTFVYLSNNPLQSYSVTDSVRQIKNELSLPRGFLIRELNLSQSISNNQPISSAINISQDKLNFKIKRAFFRYHAKDLKNSLFFTLAFLGLMILIYTNQRNRNLIKPLSKNSVSRFYITALLFSVLVCGFLLGKSPNPMESLVKGIKTIGGFYPYSFNDIAILILLAACSIIGNKIICGWTCPFGALQELLFIFSSKIKKYSLPFYITNSIRILIFFTALLVLFGLIGNGVGLMLYHKINPFNIFVPYFKPILILFSILFFLVLSLFFYRPFCQFVCPFGLLSWILESISIFRVRVNPKKCIKCKICYKSCPTGAIKNKVMHKTIPKECFSCGRCLDKCSQQAIHYD